jgi:hypothetical protein
MKTRYPYHAACLKLLCLLQAIKYWEESKAVTFNSAAYLGTVTGEDNEDFQYLVMVWWIAPKLS